MFEVKTSNDSFNSVDVNLLIHIKDKCSNSGVCMCIVGGPGDTENL